MKYTLIELVLTIVIIPFILAIMAGVGLMLAVWLKYGWLLLTTPEILLK